MTSIRLRLARTATLALVLTSLAACSGTTGKKVVSGGSGDAGADGTESDGTEADGAGVDSVGNDTATSVGDAVAGDVTTDISVGVDSGKTEDAATSDTATADAAVTDTVATDTATTDTATTDTVTTDTATTDTATTDTATTDTATTDTATTDTVTTDTATTDTATTDTATTDTATTDTATTDAGGGLDNSLCKGSAGPSGVNVGGYCIDSTEVTNGHYAAFLAAKNGDVSGQPATICDFNTSYTPQVWPAAGADDLPVGGVDWCDAAAYCAWAGKRLCGKIGGGMIDLSVDQQVATTAANNASQSEWYNACSKGGVQKYPYGDTFGLTTCNGRGSDGSGNADGTSGKVLGLQPVKSYASCVGGYPGLYDMAGNTHEWTNECKATKGKFDNCATRGGNSYGSAENTLCTWNYAYAYSQRLYQYLHVGFRCCADLKAAGE
ncbi:MAG: SUMF1/EgtB/PvdO family nonheme iron enzyme [Deltaproteobacteria bacterium]|nr:SUMF1/EgtB/PvdO family nonheme iron enzyme [Deltaproteobacteria bacterium]